MISIFERFYDPSSGVIIIDDSDKLRSLNPHLYRDNVALVPQEPVLFPGSIRDNIAWGSFIRRAGLIGRSSTMPVWRERFVPPMRGSSSVRFPTALQHCVDTMVTSFLVAKDSVLPSHEHSYETLRFSFLTKLKALSIQRQRKPCTRR